MWTARPSPWFLLALGLVLAVTHPAWAANPVALASASGYGTFHAGGVVVTITGDDNANASVKLEWRPSGGTFRTGHPPLRIGTTHFVGSLFWLSPGTPYDVRLTLSDPDGVTGSATTIFSFQTRADTLPPPTLRTLYVATTGNDGNPGTNPAAPLRHIQRAADLSQPGDLVSIQPGVYRESVNVSTSGTAGQPIVFRGAAAGVIVDGADAAIAAGVTWTAGGSGVHSRALGFTTGHVVTEQGRLFRYGSLALLQALGAGAPGGFFFDGTTLFVKFSDGSAPAAHTMNVARFEDGFLLDGVSHVRVEAVEIRHFGASDFGKGVYLRFASDCVVRANKIHEIEAAGVWIKGGDRHRVEDNEIYDTSIFGWDWNFTKGSSAENDGVRFTDDVGRGNVVRRNLIHGTFNGVGACGSVPPPGAFSNETDVYENVLYQHTDDAFEPEGYCSNVRIWSNQVRDVHMAIAAAPAAPGPLFAVRNVAYRFGNTRTSQMDGFLASALKINSGSSTPVGPLLVYHNTFLTDAPNTDAVALLNPGTGQLIFAANNVLAGTRYALYKVNTIPWFGNGNDLYTTDATRLVSWQGTGFNTLAAFRAGVPGQESMGISAPPLLVSPTGGDFTPQAGSPLVDRAIPIAGINDVFQGLAPDIGALERPAPSVSMSISDVTVTEGNAGTTNAVVTVSLSAASGGTVAVSYATADVTARAGSDYTAVSGTLIFPPGTTARTIAVPVRGDTIDEPNEALALALSSPLNATLPRSRAQIVILDDDGRPALCLPIVTTPFTITAQGTYCLGQNISTSAASGNAITINSDFVVLDLKGFKIGGGGAGPGTQANGVYALNRKNLTIKNGNIRGFFRGIFLEDTSGSFTASQGHLVDSMRVDENTYVGIQIQGRGNVVRNSQVTATSGTTVFGPDADTYGIWMSGPGTRILDNDVTDTVPVGSGAGLATAVEEASGAIIEKNRISNAAAGNTYGVNAVSGANVIVVRNRIATMGFGIFFDGATGKYSRNLTAGVATPYSGGTDGGGNN